MELLVESNQGHDTIDVPKGEEHKAIEEQLKDGKWVTTEHEDGETELLTEEDIPEEEEEDEEDKELMEAASDWKGAFKKDAGKPAAKPVSTPIKGHSSGSTATREEWSSKFGDVKTATATHKAKGG